MRTAMAMSPMNEITTANPPCGWPPLLALVATVVAEWANLDVVPAATTAPDARVA